MYSRTWMKFQQSGDCRQVAAQVNNLIQISEEGALPLQYCRFLRDHWGWIIEAGFCPRIRFCPREAADFSLQKGPDYCIVLKKPCSEKWDLWILESLLEIPLHHPVHLSILNWALHFQVRQEFPAQAKWRTMAGSPRNSVRRSSRLWDFVALKDKATVSEQSFSEEDSFNCMEMQRYTRHLWLLF